jgi:hypothetical protein
MADLTLPPDDLLYSLICVKGRFEAREGWSEAEPFLLHGGM